MLCQRAVILFALASILNGCSGSSSKETDTEGVQNYGNDVFRSNDNVVVSTSAVETNPPENAVELSGTITYDRVPFNETGRGLDYSETFRTPARGVTVELVNENEQVVLETTTNELGQYRFYVAKNVDVLVRVKAEIKSQEIDEQWQIRITDNTQENALYAIEGYLNSTGEFDSTRNLYAESGWQNGQYINHRSAAPFAVLDPIYGAINKLRQADDALNMSNLEIRWSVKNIPSSMDNLYDGLGMGLIGTSFFNPNDNNIYLLGADGSDTDEYDPSVILHEFTHFLENNLSRSDNIGGEHFFHSKMDMRLVYSEGLANALSCIFQNDIHYRDSYSANQSAGFSINMETAVSANAGWFNEISISTLIVDLFDTNADVHDYTQLAFNSLYDVLTDPSYKNHDALHSIYSFLEILKEKESSKQTQISDMAQAKEIFGNNAWGNGETNDGGISYALDVYKAFEDVENNHVCVANNFGSANSHGQRQFVVLNIDQAGEYQITVDKNFAQSTYKQTSDPDIRLYKQGATVGVFEQSTSNQETATKSLQTGIYVMEIYDYEKLYASANDSTSCFDIRVAQL